LYDNLIQSLNKLTFWYRAVFSAQDSSKRITPYRSFLKDSNWCADIISTHISYQCIILIYTDEWTGTMRNENTCPTFERNFGFVFFHFSARIFQIQNNLSLAILRYWSRKQTLTRNRAITKGQNWTGTWLRLRPLLFIEHAVISANGNRH